MPNMEHLRTLACHRDLGEELDQVRRVNRSTQGKQPHRETVPGRDLRQQPEVAAEVERMWLMLQRDRGACKGLGPGDIFKIL